MAAIKKVIDASKESPGKAIAPLDMVISGTPITKFFVKAIPDENPSGAQAKNVFEKAAAVLAASDGKDHVTVTMKPVPNGANLRINVERASPRRSSMRAARGRLESAGREQVVSTVFSTTRTRHCRDPGPTWPGSSARPRSSTMRP